MLIEKIIGNISTHQATDKLLDKLELEWFETNKRILHRQTVSGVDVSLRLLDERNTLTEGDVLFEDDHSLVIIHILPCECISLQPNSMSEMAAIAYEIGNKHLPLFFQDEKLLIPFEQPIFNILTAQGYEVKKEIHVLQHQLKTTVSPHISIGSGTVFSRVQKITGDEK
ncbi:MAG: urease accessory protein UreE, partial [Pedobacter sp.]